MGGIIASKYSPVPCRTHGNDLPIGNQRQDVASYGLLGDIGEECYSGNRRVPVVGQHLEYDFVNVERCAKRGCRAPEDWDRHFKDVPLAEHRPSATAPRPYGLSCLLLISARNICK